MLKKEKHKKDPNQTFGTENYNVQILAYTTWD
jgi:hypothetical protein